MSGTELAGIARAAADAIDRRPMPPLLRAIGLGQLGELRCAIVAVIDIAGDVDAARTVIAAACDAAETETGIRAPLPYFHDRFGPATAARFLRTAAKELERDESVDVIDTTTGEVITVPDRLPVEWVQ
jgi:hypothetical protein